MHYSDQKIKKKYLKVAKSDRKSSFNSFVEKS